MYFKVAPRQTISAAVLPKVRTPLVLHYSQGGGGGRSRRPGNFSTSAIRRGISYFKLRLKLGVEEGADGPGPLDLGLSQRVRDVVGPVYYDQFLGRTPERVVESPLR